MRISGTVGIPERQGPAAGNKFFAPHRQGVLSGWFFSDSLSPPSILDYNTEADTHASMQDKGPYPMNWKHWRRMP